MQGQTPTGHCGAQGRRMPSEARHLRASAAPGAIHGGRAPCDATGGQTLEGKCGTQGYREAMGGHRRP